MRLLLHSLFAVVLNFLAQYVNPTIFVYCSCKLVGIKISVNLLVKSRQYELQCKIYLVRLYLQAKIVILNSKV